QRPDLERLRQVIDRAQLHRLHRGARRIDAGDHDDLEIALQRAQTTKELQAADAGHQDVEKNEVDATVPEQFQRCSAILRLEHVVFALQREAEELAHRGDVVDDQYDGTGRPHGLAPTATSVPVSISVGNSGETRGRQIVRTHSDCASCTVYV